MTLDQLIARERRMVGVELGPTRWRDVRQDDITAFGTCTHDPDPMHVDEAWARRHSPFGRTIAFGFWTLSMLTTLLNELAALDPDRAALDHAALIGINYGCDRLRFVEPVEVGARIRARSTLVSVEQAAVDRLLRTTDVTVDIEHKARPALVARWLSASLVPQAGAAMDGFRRA